MPTFFRCSFSSSQTISNSKHYSTTVFDEFSKVKKLIRSSNFTNITFAGSAEDQYSHAIVCRRKERIVDRNIKYLGESVGVFKSIAETYLGAFILSKARVRLFEWIFFLRKHFDRKLYNIMQVCFACFIAQEHKRMSKFSTQVDTDGMIIAFGTTNFRDSCKPSMRESYDATIDSLLENKHTKNTTRCVLNLHTLSQFIM